MYMFNLTDAWILAAIYLAGAKGENAYAQIIENLPVLDRSLPSHAECKSAYDKFLYLGLIVADGDKTSLSLVAESLVKETHDKNTTQWICALEKQLAPYKLKSMCNRFEWQEDQYMRGVELFFAKKGE
ncbi:hypothetical protein CBP51_12500 [Cellvibrio mixtus]|uniref:Uncharacterized protein n=1 Tax=Cellvibrio mixtus TaxID=39650 RepID=A0A266QCX4_9GAMM|nr:hypothetical protein [Cellvibrio mixtus]OZY87738.1 hypothetical protein CBP51_12500 [Cellvibrio mixtus]